MASCRDSLHLVLVLISQGNFLVSSFIYVFWRFNNYWYCVQWYLYHLLTSSLMGWGFGVLHLIIWMFIIYLSNWALLLFKGVRFSTPRIPPKWCLKLLSVFLPLLSILWIYLFFYLSRSPLFLALICLISTSHLTRSLLSRNLIDLNVFLNSHSSFIH